MQLDPKFLRQHYESLSDESLLATNRTDLVETALKIFDEEVRRRGLAPLERTRREYPRTTDEDAEVDGESMDSGVDAGWLEDAAEVFSAVVVPNATSAQEAAQARDAIAAANNV